MQQATTFAKLGFVVIDEQHRFGVEHRATLSGKGDSPDVLLMTATPIPRSLALTVYGDLDVSTLRERPAGRQPVTTVIRPEKARGKVLDFVLSETNLGRQAYIVYPVIEESEKTDLKAATTMYETLTAGVFAGSRRTAARAYSGSRSRCDQREFRDGNIDILVATQLSSGHRRSPCNGDADRTSERSACLATSLRVGLGGGEASYWIFSATSDPTRERLHRSSRPTRG